MTRRDRSSHLCDTMLAPIGLGYRSLRMKTPVLDQRGIALLSIGHLTTDINQGVIPALLPVLVAQRGLSYVAASVIVVAATVLSSVLQPLLGYASDRRPMPWLMVAGILLAGGGVALAGVAPTYWLIIVCVLLSGVGVAMFHPEGYRFANYLARRQPARGMSLFSVGGNAGFGLGPLVAAALMAAFGLRGLSLMVLPVGVVAVIIAHEIPRLETFRPSASMPEAITTPQADNWPAFLCLVLVIIVRSSIYYGLLTFVPLYLTHVRHTTVATASAALTCLSLAGIVGTLAAGQVADRFGRRRMFMVLLAAVAPLMVALLYTGGATIFVWMALIGMALVATFTIAVVLGQEYVPSRVGVASGLTTGFAIGLGGATTPLLGYIADQHGVTTTLYVLAALPVLATMLAAALSVLTRAQARRVNAPVTLHVTAAGAEKPEYEDPPGQH
jgi:FSR family fosmidomycin resistance protein-like MFS transporter